MIDYTRQQLESRSTRNHRGEGEHHIMIREGEIDGFEVRHKLASDSLASFLFFVSIATHEMIIIDEWKAASRVNRKKIHQKIHVHEVKELESEKLGPDAN